MVVAIRNSHTVEQKAVSEIEKKTGAVIIIFGRCSTEILENKKRLLSVIIYYSLVWSKFFGTRVKHNLNGLLNIKTFLHSTKRTVTTLLVCFLHHYGVNIDSNDFHNEFSAT